MRYTITPIKGKAALPSPALVSSVFLLAITGDAVVVTKDKERGWDIPGGHLEPGETIEEALRREAYEEAGIVFTNATPIATAKDDGSIEKYAGKIMLIFFTKDYSLSPDFLPAEDVTTRAIMKIEDFITRYEGNKENIKEIFRCVPT